MSVSFQLSNESGSLPFDQGLTQYTGSFTDAFRPKIHLFGGVSPAPFIYRKDIGPGTGFQFIMDADVPAPDEFNPGLEELLGQTNVTEDGSITTDKFLVAHTKLPLDQALRSHYNSNFASSRGAKHAHTLARAYDKRIFTLAALNCRSAIATKNSLNVHNGGLRILRGGGSATFATALATAYARSSTGAARVLKDLRLLARAADEADWPQENRWLYGIPYIRDVLQFAGAEVWSRDYYMDPNLGMREVPTIAGFKIAGWVNQVGANNSGGGPMPAGDIVGSSSKYSIDCTPGSTTGTPVMLAFCAPTEPDSGAVAVLNRAGPIQVYKYFEESMSFLAYTAFLVDMGQMHPYLNASIEIGSGSDTDPTAPATN